MSNGLVKIYNGSDFKLSTKKIRCPIHHVVKPGMNPYMIEPNPKTIKMPKWFLEKTGLRNWKYKRDRYGNKIPNYRNHYQPEISAFYARERIYDKDRPACKMCRRCLC